MPSSRLPRQLFISPAPIPGSASTELELVYGGVEIGSLTLTPDLFADFVEGLRAGFTVIAEQRNRDIRDFGNDVDEEDD